MSDKKINWGIIGTGAIAQAFARALPTSRTGNLVAIGSRTKESVEKFGEAFKVPAAGRHASYEALLADKSVQAVYVSTPHPMHAEWAIKAAEAGKHVLCEKPSGMSWVDTMAMIEACEVNNVIFMEAFMYRCHPQTAKVVELIKNKAIGDVRMIQATFSFAAGFSPDGRIYNNDLGGGGILDVGCYAVSMSRLVAGAAIGQDFADPIDVKGAGKLAPTGVDEYAVGILTFPNNIVAQVSTGVGLTQENVVRIYGSAGWILIPNPWTADRSNGGKFSVFVNARGKSEEIVIETKVTAFSIEADVLGDAALAGRKQAAPPAMTPADSLGQMRTLDRWLAAVGVVYDQHKPARQTRTITGRPLKFASRQTVPMKYGKVAHLDKQVSRLVLGVDNQTFMPHAAVMFDDFFEKGGNAFDTAHIYGPNNEGNLGHWIKNRGVREQVVVLDKGAHTPFCNPTDLVKQHHESLQRLQTDYVDIYMMHRDNPQVPVAEFIDCLNELVKKGSIRAFGGSNWSTARVQEANEYAKKKGLRGFSAVSNNFSLARMVDAVWAGCIAASDPASRKWFTDTQTALMPWSSQARGFFTERGNPADKSDAEMVRCWHAEDNFKRRERAIELAKKRNVAPINVALAYVLCQPFPTFPLIGPRQLSETRTSLPGLNVELTPQEVKWLNLEA